ncbi:hypothetical protein HPB50_005899 [Hyalomma asiaticum]|uniref:Uncharacterized protein n=1 Tax=Hyalomma asiaticum TaxID=266040 RepID=A0ACB7T8Z2_HYAAI|nr:hypothetical protein HPB50_005899 [Hyalomma asiaticum]
MAAIVLLHVVLIGAASTTAEKLLPYLLESDDKQFKEMCKDVFEQSSKCDDVVISTETFKMHQRKYTPLLPKSTFSEAVADCVENSLSIIEMQKACSEVEMSEASQYTFPVGDTLGGEKNMVSLRIPFVVFVKGGVSSPTRAHAPHRLYGPGLRWPNIGPTVSAPPTLVKHGANAGGTLRACFPCKDVDDAQSFLVTQADSGETLPKRRLGGSCGR